MWSDIWTSAVWRTRTVLISPGELRGASDAVPRRSGVTSKATGESQTGMPRVSR
jgi:hypothetical protein